MPLLPAVVPGIPEERAGIVPARLARKIAPLFGVPWPDGPFGDRTWAGDFGRITLSEIARGAPLPSRGRAREFADRGGDEWTFVERVAVTGTSGVLPHELANATLNRFGPDTKAAVVLVAANVLLREITEAATASLTDLRDDAGGPVHPGLRLAAWAALVVEVFRSQPALVAAGIRARAIQRPLTLDWHLPIASSAAALPLTRCEIGAPDAGTAVTRPRDLDVADRTFRALGLPEDVALGAPARERVHDMVVGPLVEHLLMVGTNRDAGHLWLSERAAGALAVEALVPAAGLVDRFVRQALGAIGRPAAGLDEVLGLPRPPDPAAVALLPVLTRRTTVLAHLAILRQVQQSPTARERSRTGILDRLAALRATLRHALPDDDPVAAIASCRVALMTVQTLRHDASNNLGPALDSLRRTTDRCVDLFRDGLLDRGATAEIVSASNVEVNAVRFTNAALSGSALPPPEQLDAEVRTRWQDVLAALEFGDPGPAGDTQPSGLLGYHLHNYGSYLASHPDQPADLATAIRLFRDVVLPARAEFFAGSGVFEPLRLSLHMAARAATAAAEVARVDADGLDRAREWAALGRDWIRRALQDESTRRFLAEPTEPACRFALRAVPALVLAVELDVPGTGMADIDEASALLDLARRWERRVMGADTARHVRHHELEELGPRLLKAREKLDARTAARASS